MPTNGTEYGSDPSPEADTLRVENQALRKGFTLIPNTILKHRQLSRDAKLLYGILLSYAWQKGSCFPGYQTLQDDLQCGSAQVSKYLKELRDTDLIRVQRRGQGKTSIYTITDGPAIGGSQSVQSESSSSFVLKELELSERKKEEYEEEQDSEEENSTRNTLSPSPSFRDLSPSKFERAPAQKSTEPDEIRNGGTEPTEPVTQRPRGFQAIGDMLRRSALAREIQLAPPPAPTNTTALPSKGASPRRRRSEQETALRQAIRPYLEQYAEEFGDEAPLASTVTQAVHLYERSDLTIGGFISQLQAAQRETKRRSGSIRKRRTAGGPGPLKNKMPFYFAILEDYLGLREKAPEPIITPSSTTSRPAPSVTQRPTRRTLGGPLVRVIQQASPAAEDTHAPSVQHTPFSAPRTPSDGSVASKRRLGPASESTPFMDAARPYEEPSG